LKGAACAIAGAGNLKVAAAAPAAVPAMNLRRVNLRDITFLPCERPFWPVFLIGHHGRIRRKTQLLQTASPTVADEPAPIIGQGVP
jgi:hypothetical protein